MINIHQHAHKAAAGTSNCEFYSFVVVSSACLVQIQPLNTGSHFLHTMKVGAFIRVPVNIMTRPNLNVSFLYWYS